MRSIFRLNGYPFVLFDRILKGFLDRKIVPISTCVNSPPKFSLVLPYYGFVSHRFNKKFKQFCNRFGIKSRLSFQSSKVSNYFSLKSLVPKSLRSSVVYKFSCSVDQSVTYIGKTKRHLVTRVKEHFICHQSSIFSHRLGCNCTCNIANFSIIDFAHSPLELSIKESLHIKSVNPSLNVALPNNGCSSFLTLF